MLQVRVHEIPTTSSTISSICVKLYLKALLVVLPYFVKSPCLRSATLIRGLPRIITGNRRPIYHHAIIRPMTPEQTMRHRFTSALRPYLLVQPVEHESMPDVPDLAYLCLHTFGPPSPFERGRFGWCEIKTIEKWSKRTPTKIPHLYPGQVNWLHDWGQVSPLVHLLLWVRSDDEWLFLRGATVGTYMATQGLAPSGWRALTDRAADPLQKVLDG